ncbi:MAG: hypothetical protein EAZ08_06425 [Cytophagales bacterium]|nr:MAG: hypothetical protein EAZ08_06425 [Cytophagales bacterium]
MKVILTILVGYFITFLCQVSYAQTDMLVIDEQTSTHQLNDYLELFGDSTGLLTLQEAMLLPSDSFKPLHGEVYRFYQDKAYTSYWLRLTVENRSQEQIFYLSFAPRIDSLEIFYQLLNGKWGKSLLGLGKNKKLDYFNFYLNESILIQRGKSELYFKISGNSMLHRDRGLIMGYLRNSAAFYQNNSLENLGFGLLFGILPFLFFYNLWICSLIKDKIYIIFVVSCFIDILFIYHFTKPNLLWAYFDVPSWSFYLYHPLTLLSIAARAWFTQHFLAADCYVAPWADKALSSVRIIALLSLPLIFLGYLGLGISISYFLLFAMYGITIIATIQIRQVNSEVNYLLFTNVVGLSFMILIVYRLSSIGYMDFLNWMLMFVGEIFYFLIPSRSLHKYIGTLLKKIMEKEHSLKNERERISKDLHDNIGSRLTYLVRSLYRIKDNFGQNRIDELSLQTKSIIDDLRSIVWVLNKENTSLQDFYDKILKLIEQMQAQEESIEFSLDLQGITETYFTADQAINLYRIVQEALHNTVKYSEASIARVEIHTHQFAQKPFLISIRIIDNGKGFNLDMISTPTASHFGLQNMQQRATEIGATFFIQTAKDAGTVVEIHL